MDMIEKANYDYNSRMGRLARLEMEVIEKIAKSREEGMEKGREEGIEKGMEKGIAKVVKNMKAEGFDNAVIAKVTKLSVAEIEQL
jgi:predicted transposase/invertase (TIGR01784 family)